MKKLIKKSFGMKERYPFGDKKTHSPYNKVKDKVENQANVNQVNTQKNHPDQVKDIQVNESPVHAKNLSSGSKLILYKFDACPYCKRVQRRIKELKISDQVEMRDTRTEPKWRTDLKNRTGRTQVPCLFVDGEPMFESLDIIDYLQLHFTSAS